MHVSRCRFWWCSRCKAVFEKENLASKMFLYGGSGQVTIMGSRSCGNCGANYGVQDIYAGEHDVPRQHWNELPHPVELPERSTSDHDTENTDDSFLRSPVRSTASDPSEMSAPGMLFCGSMLMAISLAVAHYGASLVPWSWLASIVWWAGIAFAGFCYLGAITGVSREDERSAGVFFVWLAVGVIAVVVVLRSREALNNREMPAADETADQEQESNGDSSGNILVPEKESGESTTKNSQSPEGTNSGKPFAELGADHDDSATRDASEKPPEADPPDPKVLPRDWHDTSGRRIEARYAGYQHGTIDIEKDGEPFSLPIARLSKNDRKYVFEQLVISAKGETGSKNVWSAPRSWTSKDGRKATLLLVAVDQETVRFLDADGDLVDLTLARLSDDDADLLRESARDKVRP